MKKGNSKTSIKVLLSVHTISYQAQEFGKSFQVALWKAMQVSRNVFPMLGVCLPLALLALRRSTLVVEVKAALQYSHTVHVEVPVREWAAQIAWECPSASSTKLWSM